MWQQIVDKYYPAGSSLRDILLAHSRSVAELALETAHRLELPLSDEEIEEAAMLHDIGIFQCHAPSIECRGERPYLQHGVAGGDLLRDEGVDEKYARVAERHTGAGITPEEAAALGLATDRDLMPRTLLERLICYADKFYSKSGDMRRKSQEEAARSIARHGEAPAARFAALVESLGRVRS